jgi:hypothetical protein
VALFPPVVPPVLDVPPLLPALLPPLAWLAPPWPLWDPPLLLLQPVVAKASIRNEETVVRRSVIASSAELRGVALRQRSGQQGGGKLKKYCA